MEGAPQRNSIHDCVAIIALLASVSFSLQGCTEFSGEHQTGGPEKLQNAEEGHRQVVLSDDDISDAHVFHHGNRDYCDPEIVNLGQEYHDAVKENAEMYVDKVDEAFGPDFLRYPYCVQIDHKLVKTMEYFITNDPDLADLSFTAKNNKIDDYILEAFDEVGDKWKARLDYECKRQVAHQIANMDMVRKVLQLGSDEISDNDLTQQISLAWRDEPLWVFFNDLRKAGCVRRYASNCLPIIQGVNKEIHDQVEKAEGISWFAPKDSRDPDDDLGPVA
mmetsp:Transcript_14212/g.25102  ORF Transcript_14212/g.25102 Transcript_14212/m.25102 type:complete len:276 (+) Transcript_14212:106-933(+)